jgi:hypothetical protein
MIRPEDDSFHPYLDGSKDPYWNESSWFSVLIPELKINGFFYFYHRPNMNLSTGGFALWDPSGDEINTCLYHDWDTQQALPPGADMFDFSLRGGRGVTVELIEPLKRYHLVYRGDGCDVDLTWDAIQPPVEQRHPEREFDKRASVVGDPDVVNPSMAAWGPAHYEHLGRMRGRIEIDGQVFNVDDWAIHDHSWGPRQDDSSRDRFLRGDLLYAVGWEDSYFNLMANSRLDKNEDPILGTTEPVSWGYYAKDGKIAYLLDGESRVERSDEGRPVLVTVRATDEMGRTLEAVGRPTNALKWLGYPSYFSWWCAAEWDFDGNSAASGEVIDYMTTRQNRKLQRAVKSALALS